MLRVVAVAVATVGFSASGLSAQGLPLVYDNGPFETSPGFSNINTGTGHTAPGYGGQRTATADIALFDEFVVAVAMTVEEVEFYCYQTGAGNGSSTITSAYVTFYDVHPRPAGVPAPPVPPMAGSPMPTADMFATANNPIRNSWTGVYRELNGSGATDRAIMAVRVRLENSSGIATPLVLAPGTYWLGLQAAGSLALGPWFPPITCPGQSVTGNAEQYITATNRWEQPILSGFAGAQGLPFRLFGQSATPGTIVRSVIGCGNTGISVCGAPNLGGFVRTVLTRSSATSIPVIGYDLGGTTQQFCGCSFRHTFPIAVWFATESTLPFPLDPSFAGLTVQIQGAEFGGVGGCSQLGGLTATDAYDVVLSL